MHYPCEVWFEEELTYDEAKARLGGVLDRYSEHTSKNGWHDYYLIGGRYTGQDTQWRNAV